MDPEDADQAPEARPPLLEDLVSLCRALLGLPDQAVREMAPDDLDKYAVVRVADEIVIDLMKTACGVEYEQASRMIEKVEISGVPIPFASARLLWKTKDTVREKDKLDRAFLARLLASRGESID